jgi:hypothetical protein
MARSRNARAAATPRRNGVSGWTLSRHGTALTYRDKAFVTGQPGFAKVASVDSTGLKP